MIKKEKYHKINFPLTDVYASKGKETFFQLARKEKGFKEDGKKNLIILSSGLARQLNPKKLFRQISSNEGGKDALNFLKTSKKKIDQSQMKEGITIYNIDERADVAYIQESSGEGEKFLTKELEKRVKEEWNQPLRIVTKDSSIHLECRARGIVVEEPEFLIVDSQIVKEGIIPGRKELTAKLYENDGTIGLEEAKKLLGREELFLNQFVKIEEGKEIRYAKVSGDLIKSQDGTRIKKVKEPTLQLLPQQDYRKITRIGKHEMDNVVGITPLDMEQQLALQYGVLNPESQITFISGVHGSGKTIIPYGGAMELILEYNEETKKKRGLNCKKKGGFFQQIAILKPTNMMGGSERDQGFLPGNLWEKLKPHYEPFINAHELSDLDVFSFQDMILHPRRPNDWGKARSNDVNNKKIKGYATLPSEKEAIKIMHSGYLRGPSLTNTLLIIDEGQNFTPYEMKTAIGRLGIGSKAIIIGDPDQFDNPRCSKDVNGFTAAIEQFLPKPYTSLFYLPHNHRLQASEDALEWNVLSR